MAAPDHRQTISEDVSLAMKSLIPILALFYGTNVVAETVPATDDELKAIRATLLLDNIPEDSPYELMEVEGFYVSEEEFEQRRLNGVIWFRPFLVQGSLCLLPKIYTSGVVSAAGFESQRSSSSYTYWVAESTDSCNISDRTEVPADAIGSFDELPTASMVQIVLESDELLEIALRYAIEEMDLESQWEKGSPVPEKKRSDFRRFQADGTLRLLEVSLYRRPIRELGFPFQARYGGTQATAGPVVTFSITPAGFVIHSVDSWVH